MFHQTTAATVAGRLPDTPTVPWWRTGLYPRILILAIVFAIELIAITQRFDGASLPEHLAVVSFVRDYGPSTLRMLVSFIGVFAVFAYLRSRGILNELSARLEHQPVQWWMFAAHTASMLLFWILGVRLYGSEASNLTAILLLLSGLGGILFAALALIPLPLWLHLLRESQSLWIYAMATAGAANFATHPSRTLWAPFMRLTFDIVHWILKALLPVVSTDVSITRIWTPTFGVRIAAECSGLEGAGLMLVFGVVWLWLFREEMRFPQSLALLPLGVVTIFLLNAVRIAALILIGNAGAPRVALGGFHSQAGWILFNLVAFGLCILSLHSPWFATQSAPSSKPAAVAEDNAAPYLLPFLAILAAGMIAHATSSDFEWLYSLRLVAAAVFLFKYRMLYRQWEWTVHWTAPLLGVGIFVLWIASGLWQSSAAPSMPDALAAATPFTRNLWIAARMATAVLVVPLAEELAFRAYLMRRVVSPAFREISPQTVTWIAIAVSSVLFGLMHGGRWLEGTAAGIAYAYAYRRNGRLSNAVVAHATTNFLLALYVLAFQQWQYW